MGGSARTMGRPFQNEQIDCGGVDPIHGAAQGVRNEDFKLDKTKSADVINLKAILPNESKPAGG